MSETRKEIDLENELYEAAMRQSGQMNKELAATRNDAERLAVLERYMGPRMAGEALALMTTGKGDVQDLSKMRNRDKRPSRR